MLCGWGEREKLATELGDEGPEGALSGHDRVRGRAKRVQARSFAKAAKFEPVPLSHRDHQLYNPACEPVPLCAQTTSFTTPPRTRQNR